MNTINSKPIKTLNSNYHGMAVYENLLTVIAFIGGCFLFIISIITPFNNFLPVVILATLGFLLIIPGILKLFEAIDNYLFLKK